MNFLWILAVLETLLRSFILCTDELKNTTIIEQPQNQTVHLGQSVILNCKFNRPVMCAWFNNESFYTIPSRIQFIGEFNNGHSYDCSINITKVRKPDIDAGWQCTKLKDDYHDSPVISNEAWLTESMLDDYPVIKLDEEIIHELNASDLMNSSTSTLICISENLYSPAKLHWKINRRIFPGFNEHLKDGDFIVTQSTWKIPSQLFPLLMQSSELQCIANHEDYAAPRIATVHLHNTHMLNNGTANCDPVIQLDEEEIQELNVSVMVNSSSSILTCISKNLYKPAKLYWKLNKRSFQGLIQHHENGNFVVTRLTWRTSGQLLPVLVKYSELQCIANHEDYAVPRIAKVRLLRTITYIKQQTNVNLTSFTANLQYNLNLNEGGLLTALISVGIIVFIIGPGIVLVVLLHKKRMTTSGFCGCDSQTFQE